jgi:S-(hydroxymethyl)glutathione dehydrogenase/alcohol dehydrogenase
MSAVNPLRRKPGMMKAAVLYTPNTPLEIEDLTLQEPQRGEVLVRLAASGVCHSDWHVISGDTQHPLPVVLGHEGAGVIEATGEGVLALTPGDHVILNWAPNCGQCYYCLHGQPNLCQTLTRPLWNGTLMDGTTRLSKGDDPIYHLSGLSTFAERAVVPQEACVRIRKDAPLQAASLVGCAVTTGVGAAIYTADIKPGDSVAVYGCGGVGLNILQGAVLAGAAKIIAIDRAAAKMQLAETFGATHTIMAGDDSVEKVQELTQGRGADFVFEAVGLPSIQETALAALRPGGTLVIAGIAPMGSATNFPGAVLARQEKCVVGSYYGSANPQRDFPKMLDLYMAGKLKLDELITSTYRLEEINTAFDDMLSGEAARGVITFE